MAKTNSPKTKLSDAQLLILSTAAKRPDGSLLPLPKKLTAKGAALNRVMIDILCKRKLAEEKPTDVGASEWRRDENGRPIGLFITKAGLLALGIDEAEESGPLQATANMPQPRRTSAPRKKAQKASISKGGRKDASSQSKKETVIRMLRRRTGVTIGDIIAKTGWQPHSVRGFLSGLKKTLKLPLVSEVGKNGVRRYCVASPNPSKA